MLILLIICVICLGFGVAGYSGAPWVPARTADIEHMLDDLQLKSNQKFIELGSGDGRVLAAAAKRGVKAVGYELNVVMWLIGWLRNIQNKNVSVRWGNFWNVDLSSYDVVVTFLVPRTMPKLEIKAEQDIKKGAILLSYIFPMPHKKPKKHGKSWYLYSY